MLAWYDHFLKGVDNHVSGKPRVDYFLMGANRWKSADSWPLPNTQWSRYFLSGGDGQIDSRTGTLSTAAPGTSQAPDHYVYDPTDPPAPQRGRTLVLRREVRPTRALRPDTRRATVRCAGLHQRSIVERHRSDRTDDCRPVGIVLGHRHRLHGEADRGQARRRRDQPQQRHTADVVSRLAVRPAAGRPPRSAYEYHIAIWPTSYLFRTGDRIRLEISSSDYPPQFAPNPNTGDRFGQSAATLPATQTILHDAAHPSAVVIPVVPAGGPESDHVPHAVEV